MGDTFQLDHFEPSARSVIANAQRDADAGKFRETTMAHLGLSLLADATVQACARRAGWDVEQYKIMLARHRGPDNASEPAYLSRDLLRMLQAIQATTPTVTRRHLFFALVDQRLLPATPPECWQDTPVPTPPPAPATTAVPAAEPSPLRPIFWLAVAVERALKPEIQTAASRALHRFRHSLESAVVLQLEIESLPPDGLRLARATTEDWLAVHPDEQGLLLTVHQLPSPRTHRFTLDPSRTFVDATGLPFTDAICEEIRLTLYPEVPPPTTPRA